MCFLLESWFPLYNVYSVLWGIADLKKHTILLKGYIVNKKNNLELHKLSDGLFLFVNDSLLKLLLLCILISFHIHIVILILIFITNLADA